MKEVKEIFESKTAGFIMSKGTKGNIIFSKKRDQAAKTGLFGGHKGMNFTLSCRVKLEPEEKELINRYKVEDYALTYRDVNGTSVPSETIWKLDNG